MKYTIIILVRTYSIYLVPKRRNLNNLAIFGYFGYFWPLLLATDMVVAGKYVRFNVFTLYMGEK